MAFQLGQIRANSDQKNALPLGRDGPRRRKAAGGIIGSFYKTTGRSTSHLYAPMTSFAAWSGPQWNGGNLISVVE
jgi:hypothetical protein